MKNPVYILITTLFICVNALAQNFQVKYIDISSGLSNNSVTSIYQDRNGYLWFGTFDGLNRYDGYDFKIYRNNTNDKSSLQNNYVYCIDGDDNNNIWIGRSNGASVYDQVKLAFIPLRYTTPKSKSSVLLNSAAQKILNLKDKGITLVATHKTGLLLFKQGSYTGSSILLKEGALNSIAYDATTIAHVAGSNFCYVFVNNIGLCKYTISNGTMTVLNKEHKEANCFEQRNDGLWLGTDEGLFAYNEKKNSFSKSYIDKKVIVRSLTTQNSELWIATDGDGVYKLAKNKQIAVSYNHLGTTPLLKSNAVWSVFKDNKNQKWFGTLRGGLSLMASAPLNFKSYQYKSPDSNNTHIDNFIMSFCEDITKNIWIGTDGAGLRYWDVKRNTYTNYTTTANATYKIPSNFITSIVQEVNEDVWISMWGGGISRINRQNNTIKNFSCFNPYSQKEEKDLWILFIDSAKNLWAGASNNGALYIFDKKSEKFVVFNKNLTDVKCLYETADGKIWGGSSNNLVVLDPVNHTFKQYNVGYTVRSILEDDNKQLWIGTSEGGLLCFNTTTGSYKKFTVNNGLPSNIVLRILKDKENNLWMSTYNGISKFNPKEKTFRNFSVSDGLQSNQFNFNAGIALSSGEFIFGGINGFTMFKPEMVKDYKTNAAIVLNGVYADNKPLSINNAYVTNHAHGTIKSISIPYNESTLSLDFASLDFAQSDNLNYAYLLEGWDAKWNLSGTNRRANYSHLHEGSYLFKVKTTNTYGKWTNTTTLLAVTILPPWYRTWWAYMFYLALVSAVVYVYLRYNAYKERLRYEVKLVHLQNDKEKEMWDRQLSMFTFIAHELRTPLSLIINPLKTAIKQDTNAPHAPVDFTIAYRNARRLLSLTDQLLLFRKAEDNADELSLSAIDVNALCNEIYFCFVNQAKEQCIDYTFISLPAKAEILADYEKLEIALFNLVSNAFKYTLPGGTITLSLQENQKEIYIEILDTGCGIKEQDIAHIFDKFKQVNAKASSGSGFGIGLYITKYFITKHLGSIRCSSIYGKGSTFTITLLKGYDHFADMPVTTANSKMSQIVEELFANTITPLTKAHSIESPDNLVMTEKIQNDGMSKIKSILIVEDNTEVRNYLINLFANTYFVYSAADAETGLALTLKHLPDIVLSDITMEGMSGLELCKNIKQNDQLSHIPVVLLTATRNTETHLQGITEGADDYIIKPFDNDILLARIESLLRTRSQLNKYFLDSITLTENNYKIPTEYKDFLSRCIEIIESNIDNKDFSLKSFSVAMGMSHSSLYKKIKAMSGQTVNGFIRSVRLRRAAVILLTQNINVAQAGYQVGIDDARYFRLQFVKLFGITPSQYKKKYKNSFNKELNIIQEH